MRKNPRLAHREQRLLAAREAMSIFLDSCAGKERRHLTALWQHWTVVMGESLAALACPLGHKGDVLFIGADDTMAMQELSLQATEILERANAFMDCEFFRQVKVGLMQGRQALSCPRPRRLDSPLCPVRPKKPHRLGALAGKLDPDSPVTRCYEAYIAMFAGR